MRRSDGPYDVLVIGGGIAGLTAAHHAALRGFSVASMDEGGHMGGLVANVGQVDGYPAASPASGVELAAAELEAILELGVSIIPEGASGLKMDGDIKVVDAESGAYRARILVLASGARLRSLGIPGEEALLGRGVSQCADCDAGFFLNQPVVVLGGGDAALQEALHLVDYASKVTLITRGERFRARQSYVAQAEANPKFTFLRSTNVLEILGSDSVEGVRLAPAGGGQSEVLDCSGVFVFIGIEPNVSYLPNDIERDARGYVATDASYQTSVPGIYAIGAVRAGYSGRLASAVDEAISAIAGMPIP